MVEELCFKELRDTTKIWVLVDGAPVLKQCLREIVPVLRGKLLKQLFRVNQLLNPLSLFVCEDLTQSSPDKFASDGRRPAFASFSGATGS